MLKDASCDYINASYINVPDRGNAYICTQGPTPATFEDFWLMVWETGARIVLMVTNLEDPKTGRRQCHRYWPALGEGAASYGRFVVRLLEEKTVGGILVARKLAVTWMPKAGEQKEEKTRHIMQLQYLAWPDHGVPEDPKMVIAFRQLVDKVRRLSNGRGKLRPLIVHCR